MEHKLKCEAKIHDIGFRADAKLEIGNLKGAVHTQHCRLSVKFMLLIRDMGGRVTDAKINKVRHFLSLTFRPRMQF